MILQFKNFYNPELLTTAEDKRVNNIIKILNKNALDNLLTNREIQYLLIIRLQEFLQPYKVSEVYTNIEQYYALDSTNKNKQLDEWEKKYKERRNHYV